MKKIVYGLIALWNVALVFGGGILGQDAPELKVEEWVSLPNGQEVPTLQNMRGKVIYIYCYQSWCPGCHSSGFPALKEVSDFYMRDEDVKFIAIQTVFEGWATNTPERWKGVANKFGLQDLPFAHSGSEHQRSQVMIDYKSRGTPWTIIIGKDGKVKFNAFHIKPQSAIALIDKLKNEAVEPLAGR